MVYFTSNLAIDGLLAYIFIGSSLRKKFLHSNWTKGLFLLANVFAIVPDFDVFIGEIFGLKNHRGLSHSIFFPLVFIIIGLLFLLYNKIQSKKLTSPLHDEEALFSSKSNTQAQIMYLLPYFFILMSFYWGMHIVLDMDSYEGPMMLLWPFDDTLYQIFLNFNFSPFPFLILPWTPLGASLSVQQSNLSGLLSYLFNWTPQQLISYYHSSTFEYAFVGLILNIFLVVIWLYFIAKPFWPFQDRNLTQKLHFSSLFSKLGRYWRGIPKGLLVSGIILALIGFTLGPLITPEVTNDQPFSTTIEFTGTTFNPLSYIPINSISQPFDPNAQFSIAINYNLSNAQTGDQLYFVIASEAFFNTIGQKVSDSLATLNQIPGSNNDTVFKNYYTNTIDSLVTNKSTIYYQVQQTNQTNFSHFIQLKTANNYGMGFILKNWASKPALNETNTQLFISGTYSINYSRTVNYWIGVLIEIIGLVLIVIALVIPMKKSKIKSSEKPLSD